MRCSQLIFLSWLAVAGPAIGADEAVVTTYNLYSKGLHVGTVRTERSRIVTNGAAASRCDVTTHVHVNLLILREHLEGHEVYVSNNSGPVSYLNRKVENGATSEVSGARADGVFRFVFTTEDGVRTNDVPDGSYDVASMDGPELRIAGEGEGMTLRVLDLGAAEVVDRTYRWIKTDGDYRVVEFADPNKTARRWVRADDFGMLIARQDGRDRAGTYSMRMTDKK